MKMTQQEREAYDLAMCMDTGEPAAVLARYVERANMKYQSAQTVARDLGLPKAWIVRLAREGKIPSLHAGNRIVFDAGKVREAVSAMQEGG